MNGPLQENEHSSVNFALVFGYFVQDLLVTLNQNTLLYLHQFSLSIIPFVQRKYVFRDVGNVTLPGMLSCKTFGF